MLLYRPMDGASTSVAIVAIGDELLRGDTLNTNTHFLCGKLYAQGAEVRRCLVIPDEMEQIVPALRQLSADHDWVISCGGIGPTPDDLTRQAAAAAFDLSLELNQTAIEEYGRRRGTPLNDGQREMCRLPAGAELVWSEFASPPAFIVHNLLVLPGVPQILESMWDVVAERFHGPPRYIQTFRTNLGESRWALIMERFMAQYPRLKFGSYPKMDTRWWVEVRIEGTDATEVAAAASGMESEIKALAESAP